MILSPRIVVGQQGAVHVENITRWGGSLLAQSWTLYVQTEQKRPDAMASYSIGGTEGLVWLSAPDTDERRTLFVRAEDDREVETRLELTLPRLRVPHLQARFWALRRAKTWRQRWAALRWAVSDSTSWMVTTEWDKWGVIINIQRINPQSSRAVHWTPSPDEKPRQPQPDD